MEPTDLLTLIVAKPTVNKKKVCYTSLVLQIKKETKMENINVIFVSLGGQVETMSLKSYDTLRRQTSTLLDAFGLFKQSLVSYHSLASGKMLSQDSSLERLGITDGEMIQVFVESTSNDLTKITVETCNELEIECHAIHPVYNHIIVGCEYKLETNLITNVQAYDHTNQVYTILPSVPQKTFQKLFMHFYEETTSGNVQLMIICTTPKENRITEKEQKFEARYYLFDASSEDPKEWFLILSTIFHTITELRKTLQAGNFIVFLCDIKAIYVHGIQEDGSIGDLLYTCSANSVSISPDGCFLMTTKKNYTYSAHKRNDITTIDIITTDTFQIRMTVNHEDTDFVEMVPCVGKVDESVKQHLLILYKKKSSVLIAYPFDVSEAQIDTNQAFSLQLSPLQGRIHKITASSRPNQFFIHFYRGFEILDIDVGKLFHVCYNCTTPQYSAGNMVVGKSNEFFVQNSEFYELKAMDEVEESIVSQKSSKKSTRSMASLFG